MLSSPLAAEALRNHQNVTNVTVDLAMCRIHMGNEGKKVQKSLIFVKKTCSTLQIIFTIIIYIHVHVNTFRNAFEGKYCLLLQWQQTVASDFPIDSSNNHLAPLPKKKDDNSHLCKEPK